MRSLQKDYSGKLVLVVGPSGAGKDSLINGAANLLAEEGEVYFPSRIVTRVADAALEDHDTMAREKFDAIVESGAAQFPLYWYAHGLGYALPVSVDENLAMGKTVVANVSRSVLAYANETYPNLIVINVTARPEILAERLKNRGRETAEDIERRLARASAKLPEGLPIVNVDNSGELSHGIASFIKAVTS